MRLKIWLIALWTIAVASMQGQQIDTAVSTGAHAVSNESMDYTVQGTTPERARLLRAQIATMHPAVLPYRVVFVPHWQYIYATKMYHLHVPTGMTSKMFTHLPSRSVYIDNDFYGGADWLGYWIAHELGHLEQNNVDEKQAEEAAAKYRRRIESHPLGEESASCFEVSCRKVTLSPLSCKRPKRNSKPAD